MRSKTASKIMRLSPPCILNAIQGRSLLAPTPVLVLIVALAAGEAPGAARAQDRLPATAMAAVGLGLAIADSAAEQATMDSCRVPATIRTLAGTGVQGFSGDGGPAAEAQLDRPYGVAVDASGHVYVADRYNNRIRRIGPDGTISTFAGTGVSGYGGDGGPAVEAQLSSPRGLSVDASGHVYVADTVNHRIRRIGPDGTISTFAGTGVAGYGGDGGPAIEAQLDAPIGVAVDGSGIVYVADALNYRIRRIGPDGTISTFAGTGVSGDGGDGGPATGAQLDIPIGVAVDAEGNVYVADLDNHRIRRIGPNGTISTFAGTGESGYGGDGGAAVDARLADPWDVAVDAEGNVYVADGDNHRIRRIGRDGTISTFAGTGVRGYGGDGGAAVDAQLDIPTGVAADATGNVYVAGFWSHRVRVIEPGAADDHGNESACATTLRLGMSVTGEIDPGDDADWFRLELTEPASVAVYTEGGLDTLGTLSDDAQMTLASNDDGGQGTQFPHRVRTARGRAFREGWNRSVETRAPTRCTRAGSRTWRWGIRARRCGCGRRRTTAGRMTALRSQAAPR